ncbi:multidrug effflux MFS transporter [Ferrovibrio sp.]|uniref:multidrug effflux MFS transporter n=1 Tax=Ferrovibrio sp. TaxID=1917215 RepID=UPI00311DCFBE
MRPLARDSTALIVLLGFVTALGPLSTDMYLASLPGLAAIFRTDAASVQLTLSAFLAGFAVTQLIYGPVSDRFGRRPALLFGIGLFTVASVGCALSDSIEALIAWRFVQALGACSGVVLGRAMARDLFEGAAAARALSMMAMVLGITPSVAPIIGGYLYSWLGWQSNFLVMAGLGLLLGGCVLLLLTESNTRLNPAATRIGPMLRNFATLARHPRYRGYVLCVAFSYAGLFCFISGSAFTLERVFQIGPLDYGYCFALVVVGYVGGGFLGTRLTHRLGVRRMLGTGAAFCAGGGVAMAGLQIWMWAAGQSWHWISLVAPMMLFSAGVGLTMPQGQAGALQPFPHMAGSAASLMGFVQMTVGAAIGILVGHALNETALPLSCSIAAMGLLTLLSFLLIVNRGADAA